MAPSSLTKPRVERKRADKRPRQSRLARTGRPDHANALARVHAEADALEDRLVGARRHHDGVLDIDAAGGLGKLHLRQRRRNVGKDGVETAERPAGGQELLPVGDRLLDRSKRPRHDDRRGDHGARRNLLVDREIGAKRQDARLNHQPKDAGESTENAPGIARSGVVIERGALNVGPAISDRARHAERMQGFGVAPALIGDERGLYGGFRCLGDRLAGQELGRQRNDKDDERGKRGSNPQYPVHREDDGEIDRHPGHIEECERSLP